MKLYRSLYFFVVLILVLATPGSFVLAEMTSTQYIIRNDSIGTGGTQTGSSANYILRSTVGELAGGISTSDSYSLRAGDGMGIYDPVVGFELFMQSRASQVGTTALVGNVVTVTVSDDFSVGQMISIVQNEGEFETVAIGKVTDVSGTDITVDGLRTAAADPVIDGSNDVVYILNGSTLDFGSLDNTYVATTVVGWEVFADVDDGYNVYVYESGNLTNGVDTISDVNDSSVTPGSSEFGARSSDTSLSSSTFDTIDTPFQPSFGQVGSRSTAALSSRDFLDMKLAVSADLSSGTYTNTLTFVYVGEY
jgi:hypothetical protein